MVRFYVVLMCLLNYPRIIVTLGAKRDIPEELEDGEVVEGALHLQSVRISLTEILVKISHPLKG